MAPYLTSPKLCTPAWPEPEQPGRGGRLPASKVAWPLAHWTHSKPEKPWGWPKAGSEMGSGGGGMVQG